MSTGKLPWADNIRFFATIGVIILHASSAGLYLFGTIPQLRWIILDVVDSAMRCCVPLFVMLSGALILRQDKELIPYLKNRFWRIIVPFLFWALVYCVVYVLSIWTKIDGEKAVSTFTEMLIDIFFYKGLFRMQAFHFWYVYMIIGLFLTVPILRKWIKNATKNEIGYFLLLWTISIILLSPFIATFKPNFDLTFFSGYLGYFVLGYYLSEKKFNSKLLNNKMLAFVFLVLVLLTAYGTYYLTSTQGTLNEEFFKYLSPNIVLLSITAFLWLKKFQIKNIRILKWMQTVNKYSFGIYLVHIIVLRILKNLSIDWTFIHPLVGIPLTASICFVSSFAIIFILNKMPLGKHISG